MLKLVGFAGPLEGPLQDLTTLQYLNMSMNAMSGTLPATWSFPDMAVINLTANQITGSLPPGVLIASQPSFVMMHMHVLLSLEGSC